MRIRGHEDKRLQKARRLEIHESRGRADQGSLIPENEEGGPKDQRVEKIEDKI